MTCPTCQQDITPAVGVDTHSDKPGSAHVCGQCATVCVQEGQTLRALTEAELGALPSEDQAAIALMQDIGREARSIVGGPTA